MNSLSKNCSILLLCGYLGSGKTTLIQYILKTQTTYKIAVIQNEFSDEMGIEAPLIQDSTGAVFDKFYELPNGCICCSAKSDLLTAVDYFLQNENYQLDYILVETNGLADPSSTIKTFWVDEEIKFPAQLDSIISVVDAEKFNKMKSTPIFIRQMVFANCVLLNKMDKIDKKELDLIEEELKIMNPLATIIKTSFCQIDLKQLFSGLESMQSKEKDIELLKLINKNNHVHMPNTMNYFTFDYNKSIKIKNLEQNIGFLLWEHPKNMKIMRIKGILFIEGEDYAYSLQGFYLIIYMCNFYLSVDEIFEIKKSDINWNKIKNEKYTKILVIGENLDFEYIKELLNKND